MMNKDTAGEQQTTDVIVVGAGFAGIGAAIKLMQQGFNFIVLEKAAEIGGVWRENIYPDCACDIPSALYSYSFAPNPYWSRMFAGQQEIKDYSLATASRYSLHDNIKLNHELLASRWNANLRVWELETNQGGFSASYVIMACGPMHKPVMPSLKGLETFTGHSFHSAQWDYSCDLTGKNVAVIGSGASAIQFLPVIQKQAAKVSLFQRTPPWVLPKMDMPISSKWQQRFAKIPFLQSVLRKLLYLQYELLNSGLKRKGFIKKLQGMAIKNIDRSIKDPALRKRLIPDYAIGCKRILQSNNWYRALAKDNVSVCAGINQVQGNTLVDTEGREFDADVIIFATGFEVANPPIAEIIYGASGRSLAETWQGSPEVYLGTMAKDCPNCFLTFGPNLYTFSSAFVIIEAQLAYILDALNKARKKAIKLIEVDNDHSDHYNSRLQTALQKTVWNSGCSSYFIDKNGRNSTNWPWTTFSLRWKMRHFDLGNYRAEK